MKECIERVIDRLRSLGANDFADYVERNFDDFSQCEKFMELNDEDFLKATYLVYSGSSFDEALKEFDWVEYYKNVRELLDFVYESWELPDNVVIYIDEDKLLRDLRIDFDFCDAGIFRM